MKFNPSINFKFPLSQKTLGAEELKKILHLDQQNMPTPWDLKKWLNCLNFNNYFILTISFNDVGLIGFLLGRCLTDDVIIEIDKVAIDKKYRGQRLSSVLFQRLDFYITRIMEESCHTEVKLILDVAENNFVAARSYESNGFSPIARRKGFYTSGDAAITYCKYLKLFD